MEHIKCFNKLYILCLVIFVFLLILCISFCASTYENDLRKECNSKNGTLVDLDDGKYICIEQDVIIK